MRILPLLPITRRLTRIHTTSTPLTLPILQPLTLLHGNPSSRCPPCQNNYPCSLSFPQHSTSHLRGVIPHPRHPATKIQNLMRNKQPTPSPIKKHLKNRTSRQKQFNHLLHPHRGRPPRPKALLPPQYCLYPLILLQPPHCLPWCLLERPSTLSGQGGLLTPRVHPESLFLHVHDHQMMSDERL